MKWIVIVLGLAAAAAAVSEAPAIRRYLRIERM